MSQPTRHSRSLGALLGVHAGDSLGATLEFSTHTWIRQNYPEGLREIIGGGPFQWPAGHATDDTDMTRAVLLAYRDLHRFRKQHQQQEAETKTEEKEGDEIKDKLQEPDIVKLSADYFLNWLRASPWPDRAPNSRPPDIGGATRTGLSSYARSHNPYTSGAGPGQAGNGSLMRCTPTALFAPDREALVRDSRAISAVTHNDGRCVVSCAVYNVMVRELVEGKGVDEAVKAGEALASWIQDASEDEETEEIRESAALVLAAIQRARTLSLPDLALNGAPRDHPRVTFSGFVIDSLLLAVVAVLDERSFEVVIVDVVRCGKDTDTNGAIAGGLVGAREGVEGIPERWRGKLQFAKEFENVVGELLDV